MYGTVEEMKADLVKVTSLNPSNAVLERALEAASNNIDDACNRPDGFVALSTATTRTYAGNGKPYMLIDECVSITTVAVKESATDDTYTTWGSGDWIPYSGDHDFPDFNSLPYDAIMVDPTGDESIFTTGQYMTRGGFRPVVDISRAVPTVQVTAKWGYATVVPDQIKLAAIMQATRWLKRLTSGMSDTLSTGELGVLLYQQSLDPDIRRILVDGRFVRPVTPRW